MGDCDPRPIPALPAPARAPDRLPETARHLAEYRGRRLQLLRRSDRGDRLRDRQRALRVRPRETDHRQILRHREQHPLHHGRREPPHRGRVDLPVHHLRRRLGRADDGLITSIPSKGDTVVGNDVWFGYNSLIMPGVRIGDGAIIATGAVVTADVPPYTIVGGNPAQVVKQRFSDAEVGQLLRAAWWNWPVELITENVRIIMGGTPAEIERIALHNGLMAD
ncbi:CatB-related O-acetyltransferase [Nocardia tengchongensis]|uniref:CatB-related O-acetyltransferase n=1 Tax=Nocardia tengchongensis TaxID=2055889 RepID=A0ABX8CZ82_9NOCA|nr:CatB-related O-acetyltransferase [Nocardia tengchongensis]